MQVKFSGTVGKIIQIQFNNYCQNLKGETTRKVKQFNYLFQFNYWILAKGETIGTFRDFRRGAFGAANVDFFGAAPSAPCGSIFRRGAVGAAKSQPFAGMVPSRTANN